MRLLIDGELRIEVHFMEIVLQNINTLDYLRCQRDWTPHVASRDWIYRGG